MAIEPGGSVATITAILGIVDDSARPTQLVGTLDEALRVARARL